MKGIAVVTLLAHMWAPGVPAQQARRPDFEIKAAYLFNFAKFIQWPPAASGAASDPLTICVMGRDPFGPALGNLLAGERVGNREVVERRVTRARDAVDCGILFISASEADRLQQTLGALNQSSVLTVSDIPQFAQHGGMIEFVQDDNRIRFAINLAAAQRAGLSISSELLKVAVRVLGEGGAG